MKKIYSNSLIIFSGIRYLYFVKHGFKGLIFRIAHSFFYTHYTLVASEKIFFQSLSAKKRMDLNLMQDNFFKSKSDDCAISNASVCINMCWFLDVLAFWFFCFKNKDNFIIAPNKFIDKLAVFFAGVHCFASARRFKNYCTNAYVFCDSVGIDAVVATFYKVSGTHVTCIQHGQYRFEPLLINSDLIPFLNFSGNEIIVWGEATRLEYERAGVKNYEITVGGRFYIPVNKNNYSKKIKFICVVINGPDSQGLNSRLIEVCKSFSKSYGVELYLKKHPIDKNVYDIKLYKDDISEICLYVCHSSGFIVESLLLNRRFVVLSDALLPTVYKRLPCLISSPNDIYEFYANTPDEFWVKMFNNSKMEYVANA